MRKTAIFSAMTIALLLPVIPNFSYAQQGSPYGQGGWHGGMMGGGMMYGRATGPGGWYCPWMGGYGGYGHMRGGSAYYNQGGKPLVTDYYIQGNANLKIGKIMDKHDSYEATIVTKKEGALVERIQVDKKTGWFRNVD
jgi:hypothetical protein